MDGSGGGIPRKVVRRHKILRHLQRRELVPIKHARVGPSGQQRLDDQGHVGRQRFGVVRPHEEQEGEMERGEAPVLTARVQIEAGVVQQDPERDSIREA